MGGPWAPLELGEVIAGRVLHLDGGGPVTVRIGRPLLAGTDPVESRCPWSVEGLGTARLRAAYGVDQVQALWLALQAVGAELYTSGEYRAGRLRFCATGPALGDLGFPVPAGLEDLLP